MRRTVTIGILLFLLFLPQRSYGQEAGQLACVIIGGVALVAIAGTAVVLPAIGTQDLLGNYHGLQSCLDTSNFNASRQEINQQLEMAHTVFTVNAISSFVGVVGFLTSYIADKYEYSAVSNVGLTAGLLLGAAGLGSGLAGVIQSQRIRNKLTEGGVEYCTQDGQRDKLNSILVWGYADVIVKGVAFLAGSGMAIYGCFRGGRSVTAPNSGSQV